MHRVHHGCVKSDGIRIRRLKTWKATTRLLRWPSRWRSAAEHGRWLPAVLVRQLKRWDQRHGDVIACRCHHQVAVLLLHFMVVQMEGALLGRRFQMRSKPESISSSALRDATAASGLDTPTDAQVEFRTRDLAPARGTPQNPKHTTHI